MYGMFGHHCAKIEVRISETKTSYAKHMSIKKKNTYLLKIFINRKKLLGTNLIILFLLLSGGINICLIILK